MDEQHDGYEGLKGLTKRGVAQAGKPRAIKTPIQKEALEAAFKRTLDLKLLARRFQVGTCQAKIVDAS